MTHEEKGTWIYLVVAVVTFAGYVVVMLGRLGDTPVAEVAYIAPMLWTIGIAIVLSIVVRILLQVLRPSETHRPDVRDREINRSGEYLGGVVFTIAIVVPLALTLAEADYFWIANAIFVAFHLQAWVGSARKLVAYRRGF